MSLVVVNVTNGRKQGTSCFILYSKYKKTAIDDWK